MEYSEQALQVGQAFSKLIVPHTEFQSAVNFLKDAIQIGNHAGVFTGVRIIGPSGSGKSLLISHIAEFMRTKSLFDASIPVLTVSLKENPTVAQIQGDLLASFDYGLRHITRSSTNNEMNQVLVTAVIQHHVRLIALDEFQHVFQARGQKISTVVIDWVKRFMNLTGIPFVLAGTEPMGQLDELDPQLTTRISTVLNLSLFSPSREWLGFLKALAAGCPEVDLSTITENFAKKLYDATKGSPRLLKALLVRSIVLLISRNEYQLTESVLREAFVLQHGPNATAENPFALS